VPSLPATSQAWHCPLQPWSQQKPSTQKPVAHWLTLVQACPAGDFGTHEPVESQVLPAEQSESDAQVILHAVAPQT